MSNIHKNIFNFLTVNDIRKYNYKINIHIHFFKTKSAGIVQVGIELLVLLPLLLKY